MSNSGATALIATCLRLAKQASSGAEEIENILVDRVNEAETAELQNLRLLATKLQQLSNDAASLQEALQPHSILSDEFKATLSTQLSKCDATASIVIKQVMRLAKGTPREAINRAVIMQYELFAESTARLLFIATQLASSGSAQSERAHLGGQDTRLLLAAVSSACQDTERSAGILLDADTIRYTESSGPDAFDMRPPAYAAREALPPPFHEPSTSVYSNTGSGEADTGDGVGGSSSSNNQSSSGFLSSLARPFMAATAAFRAKPEPLVVPLCHAAMTGNVVQIRSLLSEGANINGRNEKGQTALICAIIGGQLDAVQMLLMAGADHCVCNAGREGKPPLFHAIDSENRKMAELLLRHGAAANQSDEWGKPYFTALVTGETAPEWIALLLSHGADATTKDMSGRPLVILAMQKRKNVEDRDEVVRLLLRHGAKPDSSDATGTSLIHICVQQKHYEFVHELLAMGADPNACDMSGKSLLVTAVDHDDLQLVKALLQRGVDPNARDIYGSYLITTVLRNTKLPTANREALAEILLNHGARGDKMDLWGVTALEHSLANAGDSVDVTSGNARFKIPELLLKQGADPDQRMTKISGRPTLLSYALERKLWKLAGMALKHGADANLMDEEKGRSPLIQAVQIGNVDAVALLLQHGANVSQSGRTLPLDVAIAMGKPEIIELLKAHGAASASNTAGGDDEIHLSKEDGVKFRWEEM
ncbi:hypothetical protein JX265_001118 [Neoarthrinium moseri]|uniref:Ankyrin repeat protein n=1 Tax=Neoarthrinium moseri TaxID=1658444 RepID=A0A9P9WX29_9PEZI|nr:uncharacterized protein JN550_004609 [Neoarthrinium moseri]KAI1871164.1 hypothetical protein JN550_004609 [Neoarthrinium moseri]KAI1880878.1 hypothetical protein JX265_001118 [Neoarthrinium moseri]